MASLKRPCRAVIVSDDNVYSLYGEKVKSIAYLRYELYKYSAGDVISITYVRNGQTNSAKLTLVTQ